MIPQRQKWKVHQCEVCERWRSGGVMISAGVGRRRRHEWVCDDCKRGRDNLAAIDAALTAWEVSRGFRAS